MLHACEVNENEQNYNWLKITNVPTVRISTCPGQEVQLTLRISANKFPGVTGVHLQHLDRASTHKHANLWKAENEWENRNEMGYKLV